MRAILVVTLVLSFSAVSTAGALDLGTFDVTGSGTFACDIPDFVFTGSFAFTGSNANYKLGVTSSNLYGDVQVPCAGTYVGENTVLADNNPPSDDMFHLIQATVTPVGSSDVMVYPAATFELGNGGGELQIYDAASTMPGSPANLVATATLSGFVTITSVQTTAPQYGSWSGAFDIRSDPPDGSGSRAPEPRTAVLAAAALAFSLALARHRRRAARW